MRVTWLRPVALARESWPVAVSGGAGLLAGFALALHLAGGARDRLIAEQSETLAYQARVLAMQDAAIRAAGPILAACPPEGIVTRKRTSWEVGTRRAPSTDCAGGAGVQAHLPEAEAVVIRPGAPLARPSRRDLPGTVGREGAAWMDTHREKSYGDESWRVPLAVQQPVSSPAALSSSRSLPGFVRAYLAALLLAGSGIVVYLVRILEAEA